MFDRIRLSILLGALLLAGPVLADDAMLIAVEGQASIEATPDLAYLSMGIEARDPEVRAAAAKVAERVAGVLAFTRELGLADRHVSTAAAEVHPEFDWSKSGSSRGAEGPRLIGYVVRRQITVRLEDIGLLGRLTEGVLEAGVNNLSNAVFDTTRRDELELTALGRAVADARRRAEALAGAEDARVGRPRRLSAHRVSTPRGQTVMRAAESMSMSAEQTYQTGEIRIEARVQAEFELLTD